MLYHLHKTSFTMSCTSCKVQTPERVGLAVLLKSLTGLTELVKVRQILCRVGDGSNIPNGILLDVNNFLCAVYAFPSIGDINEVRVSCHLQKTLCRNTQRAYFQTAVWKRAYQSIYHLKNKDGRKICCLLTGWTSSLEALILH